MIVHIKITGYILVLLASIHVIFPRYFHWKNELRNLSLINRKMMIMHTLFIALTVFLMGLLCITASHDLIETHLGKRVTLGMAIFWSIRLVIQFIGYPGELWKGKPFETLVHIIFSAIWTYMGVVFWYVALGFE